MKRLLAPALIAPLLVCAPAHAQRQAPYYSPQQGQPYDRALPSYDDDEGGYTNGYAAQSGDARRGPVPPSTTYAPPGPDYGGGYGDPGGYGYAGGNGGYGGAPDGYYDGDDAPPPSTPPRSGRPGTRSPYADRIAGWRARADACEAGDMNACRGPE